MAFILFLIPLNNSAKLSLGNLLSGGNLLEKTRTAGINQGWNPLTGS
jgi:hypothetical protein